VLLAPMAGVTDRPFRILCRRFGAGLAASEMLSADVRLWDTPKSRRRMDHAGEPSPRVVQIAGYDPSMMAEAARRNVYLEINSSPERLDLTSTLVRSAKAKGCKFVISTDAHHPKHLMNMIYGVRMARRGWLEPRDVLNALPLAEFEKAIHKS